MGLKLDSGGEVSWFPSVCLRLRVNSVQQMMQGREWRALAESVKRKSGPGQKPQGQMTAETGNILVRRRNQWRRPSSET